MEIYFFQPEDSIPPTALGLLNNSMENILPVILLLSKLEKKNHFMIRISLAWKCRVFYDTQLTPTFSTYFENTFTKFLKSSHPFMDRLIIYLKFDAKFRSLKYIYSIGTRELITLWLGKQSWGWEWFEEIWLKAKWREIQHFIPGEKIPSHADTKTNNLFSGEASLGTPLTQ